METISNPREFKICLDKSFALVEDKSPGFICYGSVICHSFYKHINEEAISKEYFFKSTSGMLTHIETHNLSPYIIKGILKLYAVIASDKENAKPGYMLIDEKNGCFPLFFDIFEHKSAPRVGALKRVLEKIQENKDEIFNLLVSGKKWYDIQPDIIRLMVHKELDNKS